MLQVENLTVALRTSHSRWDVVRKVSFQLRPGKTLALVGESGSGKTMTALALLQLLPMPPALPPEGNVIFEGNELLSLGTTALRAVRGKQIAMVFQDPSSALNPVYTVQEQLAEAAPSCTRDPLALMVLALEEMGIQDPTRCLSAYPHQLSGGMRQRVLLAMALLPKPKILIADEPTTALDVTVQTQVLEILRREQAHEGLAILLITHDMGVVAEMADEVAVMYAGEIVEQAPVGQLFAQPAHPYTQGLFAARRELKPIAGSVPSLTQIPSGCPFHPRCPYVMERCRKGQVHVTDIGNGQMVRCHLYDSLSIRKEMF